MRISIARYEVQHKEVFRVSRGSYSSNKCIIVALQSDGHTGYGEATEFEVYQSEIQQMIDDLAQLKTTLENYTFETPQKLWNDCAPMLKDNPFAQSALDLAAHDLYGKKMNKPVYELLNIDISDPPYSCMSISRGDLDYLRKKADEHKGWPILKLKIAGIEDADKLTALRSYTEAEFMLDANCGNGWSVEEIIECTHVLQACGVTVLEQPLPKNDYAAMKLVKAGSSVPLFADESFQGMDTMEACAESFHGINLKLMKVGGITPALRLIEEARKRGLKIMGGCMPESTVGISGMAVIAPLLDFVDMDSIELLANDLADGIKLDHGKVVYSNKPGLGFELHESEDLKFINMF